MFSGIQLFGAAAGWWNQAVGKYAQGNVPKAGAVLVFKAIGSMRSGHVATVSQIVSDRIIKVTHANWSIINGHRGQVEKDVTVIDTSAGRRLEPGPGLVCAAQGSRHPRLSGVRLHLCRQGRRREIRPGGYAKPVELASLELSPSRRARGWHG